MTVDPDRDELDAALRRAARESMDGHRRSVSRDETERALQSTRALLSGAPARDERRRRMVPLTAAAVALIALIGALVVVSERREASISEDDPLPQTSVVSTMVESSTTVDPTTSTSVAPALVRTPSVAYDSAGNPLVGFGSGNDTDGERTAFVDVLLDYLVNRSDILGDSVPERESKLDTAGLRIHTTLDPDAQAAAWAAREMLPSNSAGFETAIVSVDTSSAAVRALVGPPGARTSSGDANMVIAARETGSAARAFVVAAAIDAGVLADDVIDNTSPCLFPSDEPGVADFQITGGVSGGVESIRLTTARAYPCGTERLTRVVGAESVIERMYQMTASAYLDPTAVSPTPLPNDSDASLSLSSHQLSALDMAAGMQTIANEGMHHDPYFIEYIDDADGNRLYTHHPDDERVLSADASLATIDILKDVIVGGTGRRAALDEDRPAIGVTGTESDNANAWFVGATPELTTAVWVGDPAANTPMVAVREFVEAGVQRVQGGTFPADIWKAFTDNALAGTPPTDWASPPEPARPPARLVVPSVECHAGDATDARPKPIEPQQPVTTVDLETVIVPC
jgi:membrane peptidoglycan carboxypeptidase